MQFQVIALDYQDAEALNRRLANRAAHLSQSDAMKRRGELLFAAARLDDSGKMIGSTMFVEFASRRELEAWLKGEPYFLGKVWERVEIVACQVGPSFSKKSVRLDHVALLVKDIKAAVRNYQKIYEALEISVPEVVWSGGEVEGYSFNSATFVSDHGEAVFQFIQSQHPRDVRRLAEKGEGVHHVEFSAAEVAAVERRLKVADIEIHSKNEGSSSGMPWQESILISPVLTHGVLLKVSSAYRVIDGKWERD